MSRLKGGKERPTLHYSVQRAFVIEGLSHLSFMELFSSGEFPSVVAARRCSSCAFLLRLMSDVDAGIDDSRPR